MLPLADCVGHKMMADFDGFTPSPDVLQTLREHPLGGITLHRHHNVENPSQVRELVHALQAAAKKAGHPPMLIAANQEGGQFIGIGDTTPFPGSMALGATRSPDLAYNVGAAMGRELAAMGINTNYAPVCDLNTNPLNPVIGLRSFGEDPIQVSEMCAAFTKGLQSAGIAGAAKHFPGHGDTEVDSHYRMPILDHDRARLEQVELVPFEAAIRAGVQMVMSGHVAIPALTEGRPIPATLARPILHDLLRQQMHFDRVIATDALNMAAITDSMEQVVDAISATLAGTDLLLMHGADYVLQRRIYTALIQAGWRGLIPEGEMRKSAARIQRLKDWASSFLPPDFSVIGCAEHRALAQEVADRSMTLLKDEARLLPLRLGAGDRVLVILPEPANLTPADTSSYEHHTLAALLREVHPQVDEIIISQRPSDDEIAAACGCATGYDLTIVGTISAHIQPEQAALVGAIKDAGGRLVVVAMRTPYDVAAYPDAPTVVCTYGMLEPSMRALVKALWGQNPFSGRLPVSVGEKYPLGHGLIL